MSVSRSAPRRALLPVILATTLLVTVNAAIVNVALTSIRDDLGFTEAALSWVINAYLLTYGGLLIVGGRLGDVIGRRRSVLLGLAVFVVGSALAGSAWDPVSLISARGLQGIGGAIAAPAVLAILTHAFEGRARAKALGWFSVVLGAGLSVGMIAGGVILQWFSWRWVFWVNVPLGVILFALTFLFVPAIRAHAKARLDVLGAALATLTTVGIVFAFVELAGSHRFDAVVTSSLAVAVVALVGLILRLRRAAEPLIPLVLFSRRSTVGAFATNALQAGAMTGLLFFLSQFFGGSLGLAPLGVGVLFLVFTAPQLASALSASRLVHRFGVRPVVNSGLFLSVVGVVLLAIAIGTPQISPLLIIGMAVTGLGAGVVYFGVNVTVMGSVLPHVAGAASGLVQTSVQIGGSIGIAILVLVQSLSGTTGALVVSAVFSALAIVAISLRDRVKLASASASAPEASLAEARN